MTKEWGRERWVLAKNMKNSRGTEKTTKGCFWGGQRRGCGAGAAPPARGVCGGRDLRGPGSRAKKSRIIIQYVLL